MKRIWWIILSIGAAALGFMGMLWVRNSDQAGIVERHFEVYPVPLTAALEPSVQHWIAGIGHYQRQNYREAETEWLLSLKHREQPEFLLHFYIGQTRMATEAYDSAGSSFVLVLQSQNEIHPLARWYLALAYIGADKKEDAIRHLAILNEENGYRARDAGMIMAELEK